MNRGCLTRFGLGLLSLFVFGVRLNRDGKLRLILKGKSPVPTRGFAPALIAAGFEHLGLNRIQARVATGNRQSQVVCERAGLKAEGVLRQAEWLYDHYVDLTMNGMLRSEWRK